ncbi:MAG: hypothetical protein LBR29_00135, partial [Methylobacteriaceae bacterium]|nr:hypothetical protein [Methylobacteriaceae bacterium]
MWILTRHRLSGRRAPSHKYHPVPGGNGDGACRPAANSTLMFLTNRACLANSTSDIKSAERSGKALLFHRHAAALHPGGIICLSTS